MANIITSRYEREHNGKHPYGFGSWGFSIGKEALTDTTKAFWCEAMKYGEAKKLAIAEAERSGEVSVYVLP